MSGPAPHPIHYRKLSLADHGAFEAHLLALDAESRRSRFGMVTTDAFLADYAARCITLNATIHGAFLDQDLIGVAELRPIGGIFTEDAELAFSVRTEHRNRGVGSALFGKVLRSARNRGFLRLHMSCLRHNAPMRALARKHAAEIHVEQDESFALVSAPPRSVISLISEAIDDASVWPNQIFGWQRRAFERASTSK